MVEIGGEVVCRGINPSNEQWKIGIDQPIENSMPGQYDFQCVVKLDNRALATSGNYRKFYKKNGVKYAHTIDPHTGYPVSHSLLSVSVLASDAATADGFATAFMVMGEEKAISFIKSNPKLGLDAYFVVGKKDGNSIQMTEGMRDYLVNWLGSLHFSSGLAPQIPQDSPSLFNNGLLLEHVPANSPFFLKSILIAIPANARDNRPMDRKKSFTL